MSALLKDAGEQQLEEQALTVADEAKALTITDQQTYDTAAEKFKGVSALEKEITGHYKPLKDKAHAAHKAICDAEKGVLAPVQEAKRILSRAIGAWDAQKEEERRAEQRRLEAEAQKRAEEEALAAAVDAEQNGADEEEVETIISTPAPVAQVHIAPTYQRAAGVSTTKYYSAEVVSLGLLVKAAAENPAYLAYLLPNQTALNAVAKAQKALFKLPGVRLVTDNRAGNRGR